MNKIPFTSWILLLFAHHSRCKDVTPSIRKQPFGSPRLPQFWEVKLCHVAPSVFPQQCELGEPGDPCHDAGEWSQAKSNACWLLTGALQKEVKEQWSQYGGVAVFPVDLRPSGLIVSEKTSHLLYENINSYGGANFTVWNSSRSAPFSAWGSHSSDWENEDPSVGSSPSDEAPRRYCSSGWLWR